MKIFRKLFCRCEKNHMMRLVSVEYAEDKDAKYKIGFLCDECKNIKYLYADKPPKQREYNGLFNLRYWNN